MATKSGGNSGKNRKSNVHHLKAGTFRSDRHVHPDRMVSFDEELKASDCPKSLQDIAGAQEIWNHVCNLYAGKNVLFHNSALMLEMFCARYASMRNQMFLVPASEANSLRIQAQSFGLDPVAMQKIQTKEGGGPGASRFRRRTGTGDEG